MISNDTIKRFTEIVIKRTIFNDRMKTLSAINSIENALGRSTSKMVGTIERLPVAILSHMDSHEITSTFTEYDLNLQLDMDMARSSKSIVPRNITDLYSIIKSRKLPKSDANQYNKYHTTIDELQENIANGSIEEANKKQLEMDKAAYPGYIAEKQKFGSLPFTYWNQKESDRIKPKYSDGLILGKTEFPFKIKNTAGNTIALPAYITSLTDSDNISWEGIQFLNRSEQIQIYNSALRSMNIVFNLFVARKDKDEKQNIQSIQLSKYNTIPIALSPTEVWSAATALKRCGRPAYTGNHYSRSPYLRLTIGDVYKNQLAVMTSLGFDFDPLLWDIDVDSFIAPLYIRVAISFILLNETAPTSSSNYFGMELK